MQISSSPFPEINISVEIAKPSFFSPRIYNALRLRLRDAIKDALLEKITKEREGPLFLLFDP